MTLFTSLTRPSTYRDALFRSWYSVDMRLASKCKQNKERLSQNRGRDQLGLVGGGIIMTRKSCSLRLHFDVQVGHSHSQSRCSRSHFSCVTIWSRWICSFDARREANCHQCAPSFPLQHSTWSMRSRAMPAVILPFHQSPSTPNNTTPRSQVLCWGCHFFKLFCFSLYRWSSCGWQKWKTKRK